MAFKAWKGPVLGFLLGAGTIGGLSYYALREVCDDYEEDSIKYQKEIGECKQEIQHNLSEHVAKAEIRVPRPNREFNIPQNIAYDKALIMAYAGNINNHDFKLPIPTSEYFRFKQMRHTTRDNAADYVNWVTYDNKIIKGFAEAMTKNVALPENKAQILLDYVHQQMYDVSIEEKEDYIRYPLETLVERNGDCEDLAILGAALMKSVNLDVALVYFIPRPGDKETHMALAVAGNFSGSYFNVNGKKYFYTEATGTFWLNNQSKSKIGSIHPDFASRKAEIYVIN